MPLGITLHIASNGDEPAQILTFMKDKTRTVTIGRRSTQARHSRASTHDTALFRCPVISRRHAQITFLEDGTVRLYVYRTPQGSCMMACVFLIGLCKGPKLASRYTYPETYPDLVHARTPKRSAPSRELGHHYFREERRERRDVRPSYGRQSAHALCFVSFCIVSCLCDPFIHNLRPGSRTIDYWAIWSGGTFYFV